MDEEAGGNGGCNFEGVKWRLSCGNICRVKKKINLFYCPVKRKTKNTLNNLLRW